MRLQGRYHKGLDFDLGLNMKKIWNVILRKFHVDVLVKKSKLWDLSDSFERI